MKEYVLKERITRDLEELKKFTSMPGNGCTRLPFTKETRDAAEYLKSIMVEANLIVVEDSVGNLIGTRPGKNSDLPAIVVGSHYDSVQNGGNYDGIGGVITAIEVARALDDEGVELDRDFVVVAFMDEEGMRFGTGYFGSKAILGELDVEETKSITDKDGISIYQAMIDYGLNPENIPSAKWEDGRLGNYIELHIEQGPVLDTKELDIGIVTGIVGLHRYMVTVNGKADHAGTTPMDMRIDAVEIATKVISKIPDFAREAGKGTVATVGFMEVLPGGVNIVAQTVKFSIDIRSIDYELVKEVAEKITNELENETRKLDTDFTMENTLEITPAIMSTNMVEKLEEITKNNNLSYVKLPSGAGHDALAIGQRIDESVMVFVPSKDGKSHSPEEYTSYEDMTNGTKVVFDLVKSLD